MNVTHHSCQIVIGIDEDRLVAAPKQFPVAPMAKMPEEYRWASHRYYLQAKGVPEWLDTEEALEQEQIGARVAFMAETLARD